MSVTAPTRLLRPSLIALAAATVGNLLLLALAYTLDADLTYTDASGATDRVGTVEVVLFTVVPMLLGFGLAALVRRRRRLLITLAVVAVLFTLVSLLPPLAMESDAATRILLASMHLVAGGAYLMVLRPLLRRPSRGPAAGGPAPAAAPERTGVTS